ncbi:hypothetical protein Tco_0758150 [Tanacetum coccineum]
MIQKGDDQVTLLESTRHCFMPLVIPAAGGSCSAAAAEVSVSTEEGQEEQPKKVKKKRLPKQSDVLPAKKLRVDHPTLVSDTGGKTLPGLEKIRLADSRFPDREQLAFHSVAPSSQESEALVLWPEGSEGYDDSFYEPPTLDPPEAKRWYVPRWNITNDTLLDDGFSCRALVDRVAPPTFFSALRTMDYDQLYMEFNVGAARKVCLGADVRSRAEHELELKEKLRAKYAARGRLLEEKDLEILRLKSQLAEKEAEAAEVIRLRDQVSSLSGEKSALTAEVSVLKVTVTQKDHDISLLNSRAACLASTLDDAKVACAEAGDKITSLASERDRLASEDFKERMEIQQEEQAQELFNRVAELEAHVMDVSGLWPKEILSSLLDYFGQKKVASDLWDTTCSPEMFKIYGVPGRNLSVVDAYNPEVAKASYINAVKALEDVDLPLVNLLKSKKDARIDEVLDCFLLDGPIAGLLEAAYLQPCIEQLSIPIHHVGDNTTVRETSLSFALMNVHARAEGAKKHAVALRQLMMEIDFAPLSSQTWVGEASTSVAPLSIEDYDEEDTDETLGSVVAVPKLETHHF